MPQFDTHNYRDCRLEIIDESEIFYDDDYQNKALGKVQDDELIRSTVERFVYWIDKFGDPVEQRCKGEDLQILGLHLYNLLFDKESRKNPEGETVSIRKCFERAYRNFEVDRKNHPDIRLRVILKFHQQADQLASYPWEFIRVPWQPESFFLAGKKTELILTRCVPEAAIEEKLDPEERPLKILIACSAPRELRKVDAEDVIKSISAMHKAGVVEVDSVEDPTFKNIRSKLAAMKPHIFHFVGHGQASPADKPQVALMRERDTIMKDEELQSPAEKRSGVKVPEAEWTESGIFAELFKDHQPRLVFLHACRGAAAGYKFHSMARDLVKAKIPAVVAMQYEISNDDANTFAQKFYQHIDAGRSVDEAVSEGRWELGIFPSNRGAWNDRGFGTPVIYLQSKGAVISPRPGDRESSAPTEDPTGKVPCPYPDDPKGWVIPGRNFCPSCKQPIGLCPKCRTHVYAKKLSFCDFCGPISDSGFADSGTAVSARIGDSQLDQRAKGSELMSTTGESDDKKPNSVDIRVELTQ